MKFTSIDFKDNWIFRLFGKFFWLLGLLPLALDFLVAYIPITWLPRSIRNFIESGATWTTTLIFSTLGLLISAFLVYREDQIHIQEIENNMRNYRCPNH